MDAQTVGQCGMHVVGMELRNVSIYIDVRTCTESYIMSNDELKLAILG
jgi:hypothetical protein